MAREHDNNPRSPDRRRPSERDPSERNPSLDGLGGFDELQIEALPGEDGAGLDLRAGQNRQELGRNPRVAPSSVNETMNRYKKSQAQKFAEHASKPHGEQRADTPLDTSVAANIAEPNPITRGSASAVDTPVSFGETKRRRGKKPGKRADSQPKAAEERKPTDTASLPTDRKPQGDMPFDVYTHENEWTVRPQGKDATAPATGDSISTGKQPIDGRPADEQSKMADNPSDGKAPQKPGALTHERPSSLQQERGRLSHKRTPIAPIAPAGRKPKHNKGAAHAPEARSDASLPARPNIRDEHLTSQNATAGHSHKVSTLVHEDAPKPETVHAPDGGVLPADTNIRMEGIFVDDTGERRDEGSSDKATVPDAAKVPPADSKFTPIFSPVPIVGEEHRAVKPPTGTHGGTKTEGGKANPSQTVGDADGGERKKKPADSKLKFEDESEPTGDTKPAGDTTKPVSSTKPATDSSSAKSPDRTKSGIKLEKAERKVERSSKKLEKAKGKLPTKRVLRTDKEFDAEKGKMKPRLRFEEEVKTQREHLRGSAVTRPIRTGANVAIGYAHKKVFQHEDENVGVKAAHKGEMLAESGLRTAYRRHKLAPYRKVQRLEGRTRKLSVRAAHRKALHENPALKKKPLARMMQKRRIKQQYAKAARNAMLTGKKTVLTTKVAVAVKAKLAVVAVKLKAVILNPKVLLVLAVAALIIILILGLVSACSSIGTSVGQSFAAVSYLAEDDCIDEAALLYSELEVDMRLEILNMEENWPGFDEYRLDIGAIGHCPMMLMAYLTAVHHDFNFAGIEAVLREIFAEQYSLEFTPEVEIRTRTEARTGTGVDGEGNPYTYTYYVEVEYEWHILNVTLASQSFFEVINARMEEGQRQHYALLMQSRGLRQIVHSPFAFNWAPFVSSHYGWRISPITGHRQLHRGIDIALPTGTEILAATSGTVTFAGDMGGFGLVVFIDNGEGIVTVYAHCDTLLVSTGQTVEVGDVIATVGSTGDSTGPHLHFEIIREGRHVNPAFYAFTNIF